MKSDNFIDLLAQDSLVDKPRSLIVFSALAAFILIIFSGTIYFSSGMYLRSDYFSAMSNPLVLAKQALPMLLLISVFPLLSKMRFPEAKITNRIFLSVAFYLVIMVVLFALAWQSTPSDLISMNIEGKSRIKCLVSIPVYSWVALGVVLFGLRGSAPQNPKIMALFAALFSATIGTIIYAFGCTEDSPLFYALWYNLGILIGTLGGGLVAYKFLKW